MIVARRCQKYFTCPTKKKFGAKTKMLRNVVNLNVNLLRKRGLRQFAQSAIIQESKLL
jgi:hypothetical protein